jgi:hypothetical protein
VPIFAKSIFRLKYAQKMGSGAKKVKRQEELAFSNFLVTFFGNAPGSRHASFCCGSCNAKIRFLSLKNSVSTKTGIFKLKF